MGCSFQAVRKSWPLVICSNSTRPLKREVDGNWKVTFYLAPGKYEYRFVVDGIWTDDPCCTTRCWNQYGGENCILVVE